MDGKQWLVLNKILDSGKCLLIFMDEVGENMLKSSTVYYSDGTFDSAPKQFLQVYVVFGQVEGSRSAIPGMYALVADRTAATYKELFKWEKWKRGGGLAYNFLMIYITFALYFTV